MIPPSASLRRFGDLIRDASAPRCLRFWLLVHCLPWPERILCYQSGVRPRLFADYQGHRVRVVAADRDRDGIVGVTDLLDGSVVNCLGQELVAVSDLSGFSEDPSPEGV